MPSYRGVLIYSFNAIYPYYISLIAFKKLLNFQYISKNSFIIGYWSDIINHTQYQGFDQIYQPLFITKSICIYISYQDDKGHVSDSFYGRSVLP